MYLIYSDDPLFMHVHENMIFEKMCSLDKFLHVYVQLSMSWMNDESEILNHLGLYLYRFCVLKCFFCPNNWCKTLDFQVSGLRNKARTLICKMEQSERKEYRKASLVIAKSTGRVTEWLHDRLKFQCANSWKKEPSWWEKEQLADRRVVLRGSVRLPKVTDLEDAEFQGRREMEVTKGRLTEWFGMPDLLRQLTLCGTFLATINTFLII